MLDLQSVLAKAIEEDGEDVVSAYLFGSHAAARAHSESDVDVAVLFDPTRHADRGARARRVLRLASELIAATHCNRVDVVALNDAPPELAAAALHHGVRLFCTDPERDCAFRRRTLLLAADQAPFLRRTRRVKLAALLR